MFGRKHKSRSSNPLFVIFRLILSLIMFTLLLIGGYSAYKHFSGLDPLKIDPGSIVKNFLEAKTPQEFTAILSTIKINNPLKGNENQSSDSGNTKNGLNPLEDSIFKFMIFADSHNDNENLKKVISQVKSKYSDVAFIIGLGDYTDVGTVEELKNAKSVLDSSGLRYFLIAGDHDLWDSRDKGQNPNTNFSKVFGPVYQSFNYNNFKFLLLDNSDNYIGILSEQQTWITEQLSISKNEGLQGVLAFIHEPLYHPSSDHYMGRVEAQLKKQAESLIYELKSAGVKKVFSADIHYFSQYEEPVTKLSMMTVGAVVAERNPQLPRFGIVFVYKDGSTKIEDVEVK